MSLGFNFTLFNAYFQQTCNISSSTMSSKLGEKERATLKEAFDYFDKNKDGKISADELKQVMKSLGQKPSDRTVKK